MLTIFEKFATIEVAPRNTKFPRANSFLSNLMIPDLSWFFKSGECSLLEVHFMSEFDLSTVLSLMESGNPFPVDFDDAWQWLEYSAKYDALSSFKKGGFVEGVDFISFQDDTRKPTGGRPSLKIKLTIECFKTWAMMVGTPKGKEVRLYFLECEKIAKEKQSSIVVTKAELKELLTQMADDLFAPRLKKIEKYEEVCRNHHGSGYVIQSDVEGKEEPLMMITFQEYCDSKGLAKRLWNKASRRYGHFALVGKGEKPPKLRGKLAVCKGYFTYADTAIANVMEYI